MFSSNNSVRTDAQDSGWAIWLGFFIAALYSSGIFTGDLRGDGIRYASISKNVLESGQWMILTFDNHVYLSKPPLFFWLNTIPMKFLGYSVFSAKLMQVFITFLLNAVLFKTVLRLFGRVSLASLTILVANTTYVVYKNTYSLTLEPIVTLFIALSLLMFIEYLESGKARCAYLWAVFSGMAVMSKGIIGFAAFFVVLLFMILFERRLLKNHFFKVFVPSALIFTATFAWWYVYVGVRTDFFVHFFRLEFLDRLMNGLFHDPAASSGYTERPVYQYVVDLFKYHFLYIIPLAYGAYRLSGEIKRNKGLMLIAFVVLSDFVLIHFVSTRVLRYLYQPLFFASIFTAYGIECLFKADYRKFMIYASCLYFVVTSFVPHGYNKWNAYGWLQELNTLAKESSSPVVASFPDPKDEEHRAAVDYFIESYQENEPQSGCFYKVADKNSPENMMLLKTTRRLKIGVKCSGEAILLK